MDATLADVGIVSRSFGAIAGSLTGVALTTAGGATLRFDSIDLSGMSGDVTAVGTIRQRRSRRRSRRSSGRWA